METCFCARVLSTPCPWLSTRKSAQVSSAALCIALPALVQCLHVGPRAASFPHTSRPLHHLQRRPASCCRFSPGHVAASCNDDLLSSCDVHTCWRHWRDDPRRRLPCRAGLSYNITLPFSPGHVAGSCDDYLPTDSTFGRFIWNINMLARNGIYVLLDNHSNFDPTIVDDYSAWLLVRFALSPPGSSCPSSHHGERPGERLPECAAGWAVQSPPMCTFNPGLCLLLFETQVVCREVL